ncbi:hypothetical protein B0H16DRAFT_1796595 [Mycena metata]|uniref:Uncharacterized protein n=1 Tax=Mycena metata TaxID=1033252 RepID=A0AAD7JHZ3_9AGAR|nr:hypothetical protein B0H16DRAFT_1796595 [Mycena metata]
MCEAIKHIEDRRLRNETGFFGSENGCIGERRHRLTSRPMFVKRVLGWLRTGTRTSPSSHTKNGVPRAPHQRVEIVQRAQATALASHPRPRPPSASPAYELAARPGYDADADATPSPRGAVAADVPPHAHAGPPSRKAQQCQRIAIRRTREHGISAGLIASSSKRWFGWMGCKSGKTASTSLSISNLGGNECRRGGGVHAASPGKPILAFPSRTRGRELTSAAPKSDHPQADIVSNMTDDINLGGRNPPHGLPVVGPAAKDDVVVGRFSVNRDDLSMGLIWGKPPPQQDKHQIDTEFDGPPDKDAGGTGGGPRSGQVSRNAGGVNSRGLRNLSTRKITSLHAL